MRTIQLLDDIEAFVAVSARAYPGMRLRGPDERERMRAGIARSVSEHLYELWGAFDDGRLVGVARYHDFRMNVRGARVPVGGLGGLAVDLPYRREHVARDLVLHYLDHYRSRGFPLAALYPFRPDFYRRMGFGYGAKVSRYRLDASAFPRSGARERVELLGPEDAPAVAACYDRAVARTNGLFERHPEFARRRLEAPSLHFAGVRRGDGVGGYVVFRFTLGPEDQFLQHDMAVLELVWDEPRDLAALFAFLNTQADQVRRVAIDVQDDWFHLPLGDPRDDSGELIPDTEVHPTEVRGVAIMYRVLDLPALVAALGDASFGPGDLTVTFSAADDFLPGAAMDETVRFSEGRVVPAHGARPDVEASMDVGDLSSLIVGSAPLHALVGYGRATVAGAPGHAGLDRILAADPPRCLTGF